MRRMRFDRKWPKLQQDKFTTFRFSRKGKDWEVDELVQIVYRPTSKKHRTLGTAKIIAIGLRDVSRGANLHTVIKTKPLTEEEAIQDGFPNIQDMIEWAEETYGPYRPLKEPMNRLHLRWVERSEE